MQIGINDYHDLSRGIVHTCSDRNLMTEIPGKMQHLHPWILFTQVQENFQGAISAPIVHEDQFELELGAHRCQSLEHAVVEGLDHLFFEIYGNHQG